MDFRFQISDLRLKEAVERIADFRLKDALINLQSSIYNLKFLLTSQLQAIGEQARQTCLDDFLLRSRQVIFYAPLFDHIPFNVVNAISRAPIAIPRLADAADIDKIFFGFLNR